MAAVFLSASVPTKGRAGFDTADPYMIRAAVCALVEVVLGRKLLVWGGHPAITPMIWAAASGMGVDYRKVVRLYQSKFFNDKYPEDNKRFDNVTYVQRMGDQPESLKRLRTKMFTDFKYDAAVFIGGMEGIQAEFDLFSTLNPKSKVVPIPAPGGVARTLFDKLPDQPQDLRYAIDYSGWLYRLLNISTSARRRSSLSAAAKRT